MLAFSVAQQPAFKSGVDAVRLQVTVTRDDRPVEEGLLGAGDFKVTDNGRPQQVTFFQRESLPLSICVVFDASASMGQGQAASFAVASLRQVVTRLLPQDEMAVIAFADRPVLVVPWTVAAVLPTLSINLETKGTTSLNDAVLSAFHLIESAHKARRVILLITDGEDTSSKASLAQVAKTRQQSETSVYAFNLAATLPVGSGVQPGASIFDRSNANTEARGPTNGSATGFQVLPALVGDSGGVEYRVRQGIDPASLAQAFISDLRFQYTLGYTLGEGLDGTYHRVKVDVNKRGYKIRHRGGYLAVPSSQAQ